MTDNPTPVALEGGLPQNQNLPGPPSELREPRRELEWRKHTKAPTYYAGQWVVWRMLGASLVHPSWGIGLAVDGIPKVAERESLDEAKQLCEALQRVLDGEPREPECPTNHKFVETLPLRARPPASGIGPNGTNAWRLTKYSSNFCPDCGTQL